MVLCDVCKTELDLPDVRDFDCQDPATRKQLNFHLCVPHKAEIDKFYDSDVIPAVSKLFLGKLQEMKEAAKVPPIEAVE